MFTPKLCNFNYISNFYSPTPLTKKGDSPFLIHYPPIILNLHRPDLLKLFLHLILRRLPRTTPLPGRQRRHKVKLFPIPEFKTGTYYTTAYIPICLGFRSTNSISLSTPPALQYPDKSQSAPPMVRVHCRIRIVIIKCQIPSIAKLIIQAIRFNHLPNLLINLFKSKCAGVTAQLKEKEDRPARVKGFNQVWVNPFGYRAAASRRTGWMPGAVRWRRNTNITKTRQTFMPGFR